MRGVLYAATLWGVPAWAVVFLMHLVVPGAFLHASIHAGGWPDENTLAADPWRDAHETLVSFATQAIMLVIERAQGREGATSLTHHQVTYRGSVYHTDRRVHTPNMDGRSMSWLSVGQRRWFVTAAISCRWCTQQFLGVAVVYVPAGARRRRVRVVSTPGATRDAKLPRSPHASLPDKLIWDCCVYRVRNGIFCCRFYCGPRRVGNTILLCGTKEGRFPQHCLVRDEQVFAPFQRTDSREIKFMRK